MSAAADPGLRLTLGNSLDSIAEGREAIFRNLAPLAIGEETRDRLDVVFEEVIANIVRHGFESGTPHSILVEMRPREDAIELTIEDDGRLFNPLLVEPPKPAASIAEVEIGGLGIPLLRAYCQSLHYDVVPAGRAYPPFETGRRDRNRLTLSIARR